MVWLFAQQELITSADVFGDEMHHLWHVSRLQKHNACTAYIVHAFCVSWGCTKYKLWLIWYSYVCFYSSSPEQIGGDDQWIGCCNDSCKAWAGVHGGSREDTQSKWVHKETEMICVLNVCSHTSSFCSSQRQHKQQSGALVVLWSSGSGGNDTRTDLLPEEIFWSTASSVMWFKKSFCVLHCFLQHRDTYLYAGNETQLWVKPTFDWIADIVVFLLLVWFLLKKIWHTHSGIDVNFIVFVLILFCPTHYKPILSVMLASYSRQRRSNH